MGAGAVSQPTVRTAPVTTGAVPVEAIWRFRERVERVGAHRIWTGTADKGTTPVLYVDDVRYPARPIAWVLHRGTPPVGLVKAECGTPLCVHGPHLSDDVTRQRERVLYAAVLGITLAGPCPAEEHDLAEWGYTRSNRKTGCRGCDNTRRRTATTTDLLEGATAA
jgi:hypothetical protein